MSGCTDQDTLRSLGRCREDHAIDHRSTCCFVKQDIFAFAGINCEAVVSSHFGYGISIKTSRINDITGFDNAFVRSDCGNFTIFYVDSLYTAISYDFRSILHSTLSKSKRHRKRPANTGRRSPKSTRN
ncbi:hypothetical protein SDC9_155808 [bioreactor metagenome]|uniref:Uncharacterized protein n=1 Tax=bioreactor metagenome TaxID=1076179 RepID=A0A645F2H6_9ZZZZ